MFGLIFTPIFYMIVRNLADRRGGKASAGVAGSGVCIQPCTARQTIAPSAPSQSMMAAAA